MVWEIPMYIPHNDDNPDFVNPARRISLAQRRGVGMDRRAPNRESVGFPNRVLARLDRWLHPWAIKR